MTKMEKAYNRFNLLREKSGLPTLSRRQFVRAVAIASAGAYVPFLSCSSEGNSDGPQTGGQGGTGAVQATEGAGDSGAAGVDGSVVPPDNVPVGITRNADTTAAVAAAIEAAGGLDEIQQGQRVFIKPNISVSSRGGFTSLPVMRGIVEAVRTKTDVQNITIAECTSMGLPTSLSAAGSGYTGLVSELGVNHLWFDEDRYEMFQDPKWTYLQTPKQVPVSVHPDTKQYDHFILAPVLKNHAMVNAWIPDCDVDFTCCMKLFIGILPFSGTGSRSDAADDPHRAELGECVAELNCIVPKVTMCVVDALQVGIFGGPTPTQFADAGLVIASKDRVACDSVAFATLKNYGKNTGQTYATRPVWQQSQIRYTGELGLGVADPNKITIEPIDVDNIDEIVAQWA